MSLVIREAVSAHAPLFPAIEASAGRAFLAIPGFAWIASDDVAPADTYGPLVDAGTVWEAIDSQATPVGFVACEQFEDRLHIWELAVLESHQRQGLGARLMTAAAEGARTRGLAALTLTTFATVPWNRPFYARLGYAVVSEVGAMAEPLAACLAQERGRGLPDRCAMLLPLQRP
ncbi:MAG: GNAT family N-acetyltransferase [Caulobacter sp.]|nr:GNAT family N-acetyltransferase [Caulobacter sp.]